MGRAIDDDAEGFVGVSGSHWNSSLESLWVRCIGTTGRVLKRGMLEFPPSCRSQLLAASKHHAL